MALSLSAIAHEYARVSGCDTATAEQAAFVAAVLLADMVGRRDLGDYFAKRAAEIEGKGDGIQAVPFDPSAPTSPTTHAPNWARDRMKGAQGD